MSGIMAAACLAGIMGLLIPAPFTPQSPPQVTVDDPAVVAGTVVRPDGTPLEGATVRCLRPVDTMIRCATGWVSERSCSIELATTDAHGRFRFEFPGGLGLNSIEVMPTADTGLAPVPWWIGTAEMKSWLAAGESVDVEVRVPFSTRLQGTVVDESGAGVPGARVLDRHAGRPHGPDGRPIPPDASVTAAEDGTFIVPATGDRTILEAAADGWVAHDRLLTTIAAGLPSDVLSLTLHRARYVNGLLVDPQGSPLADIVVYAQRRERGDEWQPTGLPHVQRSTDIVVAAHTGIDGRFTLGPLPNDQLTIATSVPPCLPWSCNLVPDGQSLQISLDAGVTLSGNVRDADGHPVPGAIIKAQASGGYCQLTDADGRFRFTGVAPSPRAVLTVWATGYVPRVLDDLQIRAGEENTLDIQLAPGARIAGCVVDGDGRPFAQRDLSIHGGRVNGSRPWKDRPLSGFDFTYEPPEEYLGAVTTWTDDDGYFSIEDLEPGAFLLRVGDPPQMFWVASGDEALVLQLARPEEWRRRLLGTVVDAETGEAIEGYDVTGQYSCTGPRAPDPLEKDGHRFVFDLYTYSVRVTVSAPGYVHWVGEFDGMEARDIAMDIPLRRGRRLTVRVVDEHGTPLPRRTICIRRNGEPVLFEADGCFARGSARTNRHAILVAECLPAAILSLSIVRPSDKPSECESIAPLTIDMTADNCVDSLELVIAKGP